MLAYLRALDVKVAQIDVVQFEKNARGIEILGVGMVPPNELATHPPPVRLTAAHLAELEVVWEAVTAPAPTSLVAYTRSTSTCFAFLRRGLREFLTRSPDATSGVNAWEVRLLRAVQKIGRKKAGYAIGDTLSEGFNELRAGTGGLDSVGDVWLFDRMLRLADPGLNEPALAITGDRSAY